MFQTEIDCIAGPDSAALELHSWRPDGLEAGLARLSAAEAAFVRGSGFKAASGQLVLLPGPHGVAGAVLGLGADPSPFPYGGLAFGLPEGTAWTLVDPPAGLPAAVLGFCLGAYQYTAFKAPGRAPARLVGAEACPDALAVVRAVAFARTLINAPANRLGPEELADETESLARRFGALPFRVAGAELVRLYPALAAVGHGSDRPSAVAGFTWSGSAAGPDAPHVSLCGKGVCFDTGGYDLKPPAAMLRMKKDMGGAALLLGLAAAVMQLDLPVRLSVRIGCVENMVSGRAMRPMDVLQTRRGLTVEVGNTDAEGRLVLCDLLAEASDEAPDLLVDAATLTGAARVALGPDLPAFFTADEALATAFARAGETEHDPVFRLPLWAGYDSWLASPVADLGNVSSRPMAGAIVAGLFLQRFVRPGTRWLHLDTYGWNDGTRPGRPEGGEALGLRALLSIVMKLNQINSGFLH